MVPTSWDAQFGSFRLSPRERRLLQDGQDVPLTPKAFDTLLVLVAHAGRLVERQDLIAAVWGEVFVDESTLTQNIFTIRKALGDGLFIETVPRRGYRFTATVTTWEPATNPSVGPSLPGPKKKTVFRWIAAALAVASVAIAVLAYVDRPERISLDGAAVAPFTNFEGDELNGAISPDGKFVAFVSDHNGSFENWLGDVATGDKKPWSKGGANSNNLVRFLGLSPDGRVWHEVLPTAPRQPSSLVIAPLMGGSSKPFLEVNASEPAWSVDGKRLAYHSSNNGDSVFVADSTGANPKKIFGKGEAGMHNHLPAWSPDGAWIYFTRGVLATKSWDVWRVPADGGAAEQLTRHNSEVSYPNPIDNRTVLYVARDEKGLGPWLWALDVPTKKTRRISSGPEQYIALSASADGRRLAATIAKPSVNLWTAPILDRLVEDGDVRPYQVPHQRAGAPRFGGETLFFLSSLGGGDGLWQYRDKKLSERWNGVDGALFEPPVVSRDGQQVAIVLRQNGKRVWKISSADGPGFRSIGESLDIRGNPTWTPDGKSLLAGGFDAKGKAGLFRIPMDGGDPVRMISEVALNPAWSKEADLIVYAGAAVKGWADLHFVRPDGVAVEFPPIMVNATSPQSGRFLPNGKGMIYRAANNFWLLDLSTRQVRPLTRLTDLRTVQSFDITSDGKQIVFDRLRWNSDIYLIDLPPKPLI